MFFTDRNVLYKDARLLFASDSIADVLGYSPQDVVGRSCFEYFHPDEMPFARSVHGRGVHLDKAAVLSYCKLKSITGEYVTCECVFTVVYSVIVASTSLYRYNNKSHGLSIPVFLLGVTLSLFLSLFLSFPFTLSVL